MNNKMSALMHRYGVTWPLTEIVAVEKPPELEQVQDCVLLKGEYDRHRHVTVESCFDRTGYEAFLNHVHIPFRETKESLIVCLSYATSLRRTLAPLSADRRFRVIVGISDNDSSVRFHQIRPREDWISENLEGYKSEAILVFDVDTPSVAD